MRYILYLFTMALLFVGGMIVGNIYLPQRAATLASAVSVPPLAQENPVLQDITRETAYQNLNILNQALQSCPVVVNEEKDRLVNQIRLLLALEDFEIKKARLELEMAKNTDTNRPTSQFTQAVSDYNAAREFAEQLANELFPIPEPEVQPAESAPQETTAAPNTAEAENPEVSQPSAQSDTETKSVSASQSASSTTAKKAPAATGAEASSRK